MTHFLHTYFSPAFIVPTCGVCHKKTSRLCGACRDQRYCSAECQLKEWPLHKLLCADTQKQTNRQRFSVAPSLESLTVFAPEKVELFCRGALARGMKVAEARVCVEWHNKVLRYIMGATCPLVLAEHDPALSTFENMNRGTGSAAPGTTEKTVCCTDNQTSFHVYTLEEIAENIVLQGDVSRMVLALLDLEDDNVFVHVYLDDSYGTDVRAGSIPNYRTVELEHVD